MSNALLVIDVQKEYQAGGKLEIKGFDRAAQNISKLLAWAREGNAAIFHFQHISAVLGDDVFAPPPTVLILRLGSNRSMENVLIQKPNLALFLHPVFQRLLQVVSMNKSFCAASHHSCAATLRHAMPIIEATM